MERDCELRHVLGSKGSYRRATRGHTIPGGGQLTRPPYWGSSAIVPENPYCGIPLNWEARQLMKASYVSGLRMGAPEPTPENCAMD
ncbi:hypothetical protein SARC_14844 [Sphaeroforma arctica JP610]|uniref:Uncharacterized protein n=1 Tax=Sphaeroforma arctica JP610 TaxID=667725 RepID=A0A0L0F922_9EUKA|nr:hypothetical protein SARC_14844 [Sphaeroforma arctica JP610]KNC72598.1 hypothetical protein SARC_14844 [Sphaeroforma arctica JP610]|eukprot:XP_014146500.1 hypothetical protein SARC_14844 [Sphaeroforma arctica JP610]